MYALGIHFLLKKLQVDKKVTEVMIFFLQSLKYECPLNGKLLGRKQITFKYFIELVLKLKI
jgi:hypothetical protein